MRSFFTRITAVMLGIAVLGCGIVPVNAEALTLGDCNDDGVVDSADASDVLRYYAELSTGSERQWSAFEAADMDGSGYIDSSDASYVLAYYAARSTGAQLTSERFMELKNAETEGFNAIGYTHVDFNGSCLEYTVAGIEIYSMDFSADSKDIKCIGGELSLISYSRNCGDERYDLVEKIDKVNEVGNVETNYGVILETGQSFTVRLPEDFKVDLSREYYVSFLPVLEVEGVTLKPVYRWTGELNTVKYIVDNAKLTPHDNYPLYNIKVNPPVYKATYTVSANDKRILDKFAAEHFTEDMSNYDKIEYTWRWLNYNVTYASGSLYSQIAANSWVEACFEKKMGQCLQYNGALAEMLAYMGYDVYLLEMWLDGNSNQHFRAEVNIDGQAYSIEVGNDGSYSGWMWLFSPVDSSIAGLKS